MRRLGPPVGHRAVAHGGQPWISCRRRSISERRSSRLRTAERVRPRHEARLVCPALRQLALTQLRREADQRLISQTCLLRATRAYCKFASFVLRTPPSIAPRIARASLDTALSPASRDLPRALPDMQLPRLFFGASGTSGILALACILDSRPRIISDEESPFVEDFMGPRANLQKEPDRSSRDGYLSLIHI